jgi:peptidoglycan-associated lipoprotein
MTSGRRKLITMTLTIVFSTIFFYSCAKKEVLQEEIVQPGVTPKRPSAVSKAPSEGVPSKAPEEETIKGEEAARRLGVQFKKDAKWFQDRDIYFDFDKYDLKPEARAILVEKAEFLKKYPTVRILIEGHCDERGTNEYNLALGERRANSVKQYLIHLGISPDRLSTISYGEERPVDPRHNEEAWAKNRRAHLVIISY